MKKLFLALTVVLFAVTAVAQTEMGKSCDNPIPVNNYCYCCIQMGFITKRYERRFQYTRQEQRQGI